jgi:hypothetical protein
VNKTGATNVRFRTIAPTSMRCTPSRWSRRKRLPCGSRSAPLADEVGAKINRRRHSALLARAT